MLGKFGGKTKLIFYIFCPPSCLKNVPAPPEQIDSFIAFFAELSFAMLKNSSF